MAMIRPERMTIVSPSKWLARESERSELFGSYRHEVIPYGLSTTTFAPLDREQQRKKLGLSKEEFVFGCVSQVLQDPRKNYQTMIEALESISGLHRRQIVLLSVGEGAWKSQTIKCINLGTLSDEARMAEVYSAMDCFVCPSLEDNLPNTILEAMACGCPTAAFDAGGIADLVRSNVTGWLVTEKSKEGLATALLCAMNQTEEQRRSLSLSCRGTALREYAQEVQARKYQNLFEDVLAGAGTTLQGEVGHP
jgi:glycosyltransferase involved in cell wall biosynthesis